MGQSLTVALKSIRVEIDRFRRKRTPEVQQRAKQETEHILAASGICVGIQQEPDEALMPDPPYL
tara:strand:- start:228 stop:419 length:192 start_codon:yes stop_codon:yes gene_type:complete